MSGIVVRQPRLLDVCCGVGGATRGYQQAGWHVTGVDKEPQPNYVGDHFVRGDALAYLADRSFVAQFDAIHASFPCQFYTTLIKGNQKATAHRHVDLIPPGRRLLQATGLPWVMENVPTAGLRRDVVLCGEMFGLQVIRHRAFEFGGWTTTGPAHVKHRGRVKGWRHGVCHRGYYYAVYGDGGGKGTLQEWRDAMGMQWPVERLEIAEAIPPAYAQFIGSRLIGHGIARPELVAEGQGGLW